jgi:hypothetical protein
MSRTVRELIRVLERAASHAPNGDLATVVIDARTDFRDDPFYLGIPGEGETAVGAHLDVDTMQIVIETEEITA